MLPRDLFQVTGMRGNAGSKKQWLPSYENSQALDIDFCFSELLGRNSVRISLRISIPFQNPLVSHPVFCYFAVVYVHTFTVSDYVPIIMGGLQVIQVGPLCCRFTFFFF